MCGVSKSLLYAVLFILLVCFVFDHASAQMQLLQSFTEAGSGNEYAAAVSNAGDLNNDGYDDVVVGAYKYGSEAGRVFIYFGGDPMDNTVDLTLYGQDPGDQFGFAVAGAGDVNDDGFGDVIIGAPGRNSKTGKVYIYFGGDPMNTTADILLYGQDTDDYYGLSVDGAGDVNKDNYDDVIVGAPSKLLPGAGVYILRWRPHEHDSRHSPVWPGCR